MPFVRAVTIAAPDLYEVPNYFHVTNDIERLHLNERSSHSIIVHNPLRRRRKLIISFRRGMKLRSRSGDLNAAAAESGTSVTSIVSPAL